VTVTLASNPASLKVYDIPLYNGTIDATSSASGGPANAPTVNTGSVTITHAPDLLLGNLIMANQRFTPKTYWGLTLDDGSDPMRTMFFPADDGADFLPGFGVYSGSADAGHEFLGSTGTHSLSRMSYPGIGSMTDFGGVAIAIELSGTPSESAHASGSKSTSVAASAVTP